MALDKIEPLEGLLFFKGCLPDPLGELSSPHREKGSGIRERRILEGGLRKGDEKMLLLPQEGLVGFFLCRTVDLNADFLPAPAKGAVVGLGDIPEGSAGEEVLPDRGHRPFHLALVLRGSYPGGISNESVVALHVGVRSVYGGVVYVSLHHARLQVVEDYPFGYAAEEGEGPLVAVEPGTRVLAEDEPDELVAACGEGHDEGPCPAVFFAPLDHA